MPEPIEIFRAGTHKAMNGRELTFSTKDLDAIVAGYNKDTNPAPLVLGHPKTEDMAYGWTQKLSRKGDILYADTGEVSDELINLVRAEKYKKVSAAFFLPDSPANPTPGQYHLKHIGFLGAVPPAVTGLKPVSFAGISADDIVEFGWAERSVPRVLRGIRDLFIGALGLDLDVVENAIPSWELDTITEDALKPDPDPDPAYAAPTLPAVSPTIPAKKEDPMPKTEAELAAREAELAAREKKANDRDAAFAATESLSAATAFVEAMAVKGKVLPAQKETMAAFVATLNDADNVASFAAGADERTQAGYFRGLIENQPNLVELGELTAGSDANAATAAFAAPDGIDVDKDRLELHNKALAYAAANKCDYITAVRALGG